MRSYYYRFVIEINEKHERGDGGQIKRGVNKLLIKKYRTIYRDICQFSSI